jgi:hypothetical protein
MCGSHLRFCCRRVAAGDAHLHKIQSEHATEANTAGAHSSSILDQHSCTAWPSSWLIQHTETRFAAAATHAPGKARCNLLHAERLSGLCHTCSLWLQQALHQHAVMHVFVTRTACSTLQTERPFFVAAITCPFADMYYGEQAAREGRARIS